MILQPKCHFLATRFVYISQESTINFIGRPHSIEWATDNFASMILAHNERVKKELARRQRARGIEPVIISTYLTGADKQSGIQPGQVAIAIDDSESTNNNPPGSGPHAYFDQTIEERFQPKAGRTSDPNLVRMFFNLAKQQGKIVHPAVVVGTPGAPEYQSLWEIGLLRAGFDQAKWMDLTREVVGYDLPPVGLFYGMGISAEAAVWRGILPGEPDFRVLHLVLGTDEVGGQQSLRINHRRVFLEALMHARPYRDLIFQMIGSMDKFPQQQILPHTFQFDLSHTLPQTQ